MTWVLVENVKGPKGDRGPAGTISSVSIDSLPNGVPATVEMFGLEDVHLHLGLPVGGDGPRGPAGAVASVTAVSVAWDAPAEAIRSEVGGLVSIELRIPRGPAGGQGETGAGGTITSATASGLAAGAAPTVTLGGTPQARTLALGIPKGDPGVGGTITSATAAALAAGAAPTVTLGGTPQVRTIAFGIPKGDKGDPGSGSVNSVNGDLGPAIVLGAADVGAVPVGDTAYLFPPGFMAEFGGAVAPAGWLACDGALVSRTTYAALFAAIGTAHGVGNGTTTFALPDSRGVVTAGVDPSDPALDAVGKVTGSKNHTLTAAQLPNLTAASAGNHTHTPLDGNRFLKTDRTTAIARRVGTTHTSGAWVPAVDEANIIEQVTTTNSTGAHTHTVNSGGGQAHPIMQPTLAALKMIKI